MTSLNTVVVDNVEIAYRSAGPAGAHAFARDLPEAEVVLLDAGHFAALEATDEVAHHVGTFLARTLGAHL